ncbi:hypothetical protein [Lysinibacillus pakistanensis]
MIILAASNGVTVFGTTLEFQEQFEDNIVHRAVPLLKKTFFLPTN